MALINIVDECWGETKAETIVKVQLNNSCFANFLFLN
jgi:hypothetical protein